MIDYERDLNPAQREAATAPDGPTLVIAGAGSGKTRTIVYRLAYLVESGVPPDVILLLTFTRKASNEMLRRAEDLLSRTAGRSARGALGGTFHSFAYSCLRRFGHVLGYKQGFTVMDRADAEDALSALKSQLGLAKADKTFPKKSALVELLSKARNKELTLPDMLSAESPHLLPFADALLALDQGFADYKRSHGLMDYDDLLFHLERLMLDHPEVARFLRERSRHVLVDEYQDTNAVQARLVRLIAGEPDAGGGNVFAVGDDAQSIYAFRGAAVRNILRFPDEYPGARIVRLEQNYRSTQPILDLTNEILAGAPDRFEKKLFSERADGPMPTLVKPLSDLTQARLALEAIQALNKSYPLHEIAVLVRAGYQTYALEVVLNKMSLPFVKYGGQRFTEAAHVKDVMACLRLALNPSDLPAWTRAASLLKGVGPKTSAKIFQAVLAGDRKTLLVETGKKPELQALLDFLDDLRAAPRPPAAMLQAVIEWYGPHLIERHPEDHPRRLAGLEQLAQIATGYESLDQLLADLCLDSPGDGGEGSEGDEAGRPRDALVLSTVHSAKGLEWSAALVLDLVEERFPSRHALERAEALEEERRLLYVACTRARDRLTLFAPVSLYNRYKNIMEPAVISPFLRAIPRTAYEELREATTGELVGVGPAVGRPDNLGAPGRPVGEKTWTPRASQEAPTEPRTETAGRKGGDFGYCHHKIFGRGKIIAASGPDKFTVNFPGFGPKTILRDYLTLENAPKNSLEAPGPKRLQ